MRIVYFDCADPARRAAKADPALFEGIELCHGEPEGDADLVARLQGAAVAINGHSLMPDAVLEALAPTLKRIVFLGTGVSTFVNLSLAERLGIEVLACRNYGSRTIAEFAIGLLLSATRQIATMDRAVRSGTWTVLGGMELHGKTLGIVGLGGIGKETAKLGAALGMKVLAWNRSPVSEELPVEMTTLEDLFDRSHAVSLHVATTPETTGLVDAGLLGRLPKGAILVNVARGELVDQDALLAALTDGSLGHAAIDVYPEEPVPADYPLLNLENVTLTCHAAWNTADAAKRLFELGISQAKSEI